MDAQFPLRTRGNGDGRQEQAVRHERGADGKRRHDQHGERGFQRTEQSGAAARIRSHQRFLRLPASLIAASISGIRAFASSYPISNIASVAARETSVGLKS